MAWLLAALGLVILLLAGDALVKGAVNLSLRLGVPAMIVSLTIVAFGTSAPELLIAISAVLEDAPGIAIGNGEYIDTIKLIALADQLIKARLKHPSDAGAIKVSDACRHKPIVRALPESRSPDRAIRHPGW